MNLGRWKESNLDDLLAGARRVAGVGERIAFLSKGFLGTPYQEGTLLGDATTPEEFVVNLAVVDCFTFIDYVEAMRLSGSFGEFLVNVRRVRYRGGRVAFEDRNHFFTDWIGAAPRHVEDVTGAIGRGREVRTLKHLNRKVDGGLFLPGIPVREREVTYIPAAFIDAEATEGLQTGDYLGIYTEVEGLDASHVGVVVRGPGEPVFRHASSQEQYRRVVDEDLFPYLAGKPGIIVLRPVNP